MEALIKLYEYFFDPIKFFKENKSLPRIKGEFKREPDLNSSMYVFNPYYAKFWEVYDKKAMHGMIYPVVWFPKYSRNQGDYMVNGPVTKYSSLKLIERYLPPKIYNKVMSDEETLQEFIILCRTLQSLTNKLA